MTTQTAVVTGGAGFIGSHLVDALQTDGWLVLSIDDMSRGHNRNAASMDIVDLSQRVVRLPQVDVLFHLAARVTGIEYNRHNQYRMLHANTAINLNVAEAVRLNPPKRLIWVSTACVYPPDAPVPTPESAARVCNPEPTNWGYGVAKWHGEQMATYLDREFDIPTAIVRFFNAFGPRDYYDEATSHVAPALIRRFVDGEDPVVVWGTGTQTRALVDARDIAKALVLLAETDYRGIVNIGHEREVSIAQLAETIKEELGSKQGIVFDKLKPDGYPRRAADTTLLRDLIGYVPDTPLCVTIADMIEDYRARTHSNL